MSDMYDKIEDLMDRKVRLEKGEAEKIRAQHAKGKLTARERIHLLLDEGSFVELNHFVEPRTTCTDEDEKVPGDGVVTGYGKIEGRFVFVYAQDFTVFGGSVGEMHAQKIARIMDLAAQNGAPIISLHDSGGARIQEGVLALDGYGQIFSRNVLYSGVIPQISVILGPCAGGAVYSPALTDFVFMVEETSQMFITGPKVLETVTGEKITAEALGGAKVHAHISGNAHFVEQSEKEVLAQVRRLLRFLPQNHKDFPPRLPCPELDDWREGLADVVPMEGTRAYDVHQVIKQVLDQEDFMEVHASFAKNVVIGFGRIGGVCVGIVANQPKVLAGCIDIHAADKLARFIRFCDCFNIPLITLVDVTGFLPGIAQEHGAIIRHGAKILYAYAEATVPKITVILRKAYGGAYVALNSKAIGADFVFAWPSAEIAVMGPEGAASIIYAKEIEASDQPESLRWEKIAEYRARFANPYAAAACGMVDDVIDPRATRKILKESLTLLSNKQAVRPRKKHGNIPL